VAVAAGMTSTYRQLTHGCCLGKLASGSLLSCAVGGRVPWQAQLDGACQQPSCLYHCTMTVPAGCKTAGTNSRKNVTIQHRLSHLLLYQPDRLARYILQDGTFSGRLQR
jgi:hypothetical protein